MPANPVPGEVYDAALRIAAGGTDPDDRAAVDGHYVRTIDVLSLLAPSDYAAEAREILKHAAEHGVARVCRG